MKRLGYLVVVAGMLPFLAGCSVVPAFPDLWPFNNEYIPPGTPIGEAAEN